MFSIPPITPITPITSIAPIALMSEDRGGICIVVEQLDIVFVFPLCRETIICSTTALSVSVLTDWTERTDINKLFE